MTQRNILPWRYTTLRGLHSNKTSWHPDRDGFIEYFNVENLEEFRRIRRGGASWVASKSLGASYTNKVPKAAIDFNWINTTDTAATFNVRYLMLAGKYSWYTVSNTPTITTLTMPTYAGHTIVYTARPSMAVVKDRCFLCTSARASWTTGVWTVDTTKKYITNTSDWSDDIKHGDPVFINGGKYIVDHRDALDHKKLHMTAYYAGSLTVSSQNASATRIGNLLVYDPMDQRTGANPVALVGAVPPPDQMLYSVENYYHTDSANGWIWGGNNGVVTYCKVRSGNEEITFWSDLACTVAMALPTAVATDDYFYLDGVEYRITGTDLTGGVRNIINISKNAGQDATQYYDGVDEVIALTANTQNEINDATYRWSLFFGELTCNVQYALAYAYYNSRTGHLSNASPVSYLKTSYKKFNIKITQWNDLFDNDPNLSIQYDTVIFFRSADGAVNLQDTKRIPSTTVPGSVIDNIADDDLGSMYAPLAFTNNPPPSLMMIDEYQGRLWGIGNHERNKVFYSSDEAQLNSVDEFGTGAGRAEECWPPTNYLVIPSTGGNGNSLKKCGDYLYVGTDNGLYVITGYDQISYSMERIFGQDGVYPQSIVEYNGPLTNGAPGAFFLTKGFRAYVIAPGLGVAEIGAVVGDKLQTYAGYDEVIVSRVASAKRDYSTDAIGGMTFLSNKSRNYILITGYKDIDPLGAHNYSQHETMVYDIDIREWYQHQHKLAQNGYYTASDSQSAFHYGTSLFGYPIIISTYLSYSNPNYYVNLAGTYNDYKFQDHGVSYTAYLQTSWLDYDNTVARSSFKTMNRCKIYTASTGTFTLDYYTDESATPTRTGISFAADVTPFQEATTKEKVALVQSASGAGYGPGWLYGHSLSAKITFPSSAQYEHIDYIEIEASTLGQKE